MEPLARSLSVEQAPPAVGRPKSVIIEEPAVSNDLTKTADASFADQRLQHRHHGGHHLRQCIDGERPGQTVSSFMQAGEQLGGAAPAATA